MGTQGGEDGESDDGMQQGGEDEHEDEDFWEAQGMGADAMQQAAAVEPRVATQAEAQAQEEERDAALTASLEQEFQGSMKAWRQAARNIQWKEEKVCDSVKVRCG